MRLNFQILIVVALALVLGGGSAWYTLERTKAFGGISVGSWTAWPFAGGADTDPYINAKVAKDGIIPLGVTEGLAFEAKTDSAGNPLTLNCNYLLSGLTPPARLWTLAAYRANGEKVAPAPGSTAELHSGSIVRSNAGAFRIKIGTYPISGNWLGLSGTGEFYLVLRVYDTPATSNTGLVSTRMPSVLKGECAQ